MASLKIGLKKMASLKISLKKQHLKFKNLKPTTKFLERVAASKKIKMPAIQDGGSDSKVCHVVKTVYENKAK